jgi:hypothetical protein
LQAPCEAITVLDRTILSRSRFWKRFPKPVVEIRVAIAGFRRWMMWTAVAAFGARAYKLEQAKGDAPALEHEMLEAVVQMLNDAPDPSRSTPITPQ